MEPTGAIFEIGRPAMMLFRNQNKQTGRQANKRERKGRKKIVNVLLSFFEFFLYSSALSIRDNI